MTFWLNRMAIANKTGNRNIKKRNMRKFFFYFHHVETVGLYVQKVQFTQDLNALSSITSCDKSQISIWETSQKITSGLRFKFDFQSYFLLRFDFWSHFGLWSPVFDFWSYFLLCNCTNWNYRAEKLNNFRSQCTCTCFFLVYMRILS